MSVEVGAEEAFVAEDGIGGGGLGFHLRLPLTTGVRTTEAVGIPGMGDG